MANLQDGGWINLEDFCFSNDGFSDPILQILGLEIADSLTRHCGFPVANMEDFVFNHKASLKMSSFKYRPRITYGVFFWILCMDN